MSYCLEGQRAQFSGALLQRRVAGVDGFLGLKTLRFARFAGKSSRSRKARAHRSCVRPVRATATSPCNINYPFITKIAPTQPPALNSVRALFRSQREPESGPE